MVVSLLEYSCRWLQYKFVTPLTSLLVIKPNTTATETALKRAGK